MTYNMTIHFPVAQRKNFLDPLKEQHFWLRMWALETKKLESET